MSNPPSLDNKKFNSKIDDITIQIDQTKDVMKDNIEKTLQRGEDLDRLIDKTDEMNKNASVFQKKATVLRKHMCWQNYKYMLLIGFIVLIVLIVLGLIIYAKTKK